MAGSIIIKPAVQQRFDSFIQRGRVLFVSAPCGFGKSTLADALLEGRSVLRLSTGAPDFSLDALPEAWDILLIDDFQQIPEGSEEQTLCQLIRSTSAKHFVLLSRGAPPSYLTAFQYAGLMTTLEADDLLFDREDIRKYFALSGVPITDSEISGLLKGSIGYPQGIAVTARCMSGGKSFGPEVAARVYREVFSYFEDAIYRRFDLPVRRFLLELAPFERFDLEMARMVSGTPPRRRAAGLAPALHHYAPLTALDAVVVNSGRFVVLAQTGFGHADGHRVLRVIINQGELAGILRPCGDLIGAGGIAEELDNHVVLVVANTLAQSIHIGILTQAGSLGGNRGQGAQNLVVHDVAHGSGSGMSVTVRDVGQAAVVLSGAILALTDGLFQIGVAGLVFGVNDQIVKPLAAIDGRHGQGDQEGIAGRSHVFGDAGFHHQIKPLLHVGCRGMTGRIGLSHGNAAVLNSNLQSGLHVRGIGSQCSGQFVVQSIAGEVVDTIFRLTSIGSSQTNGGQHGIGTLRATALTML